MATYATILMRQTTLITARISLLPARKLGQAQINSASIINWWQQQLLFRGTRPKEICTFALGGVDCFDPAPAAAHRLQQVRWKGRNDGSRFAYRVRKPTRKQRRKYNLRLRRLRQEQESHSPPGSKAALRREEEAYDRDELLKDTNNVNDRLLSKEYGAEDALLDDLVGNTNMAEPTPEPLYLGHRQSYFFNKVADQMENYRNYLKHPVEESESMQLALIPEELPSDKDISLALRAYRDKHGTKQKPIGIVSAMQHIIQDMGVPLDALDQLSYTTLLTCCRTEPEARRVFQLMRDQQVPITVYGWSILVDILAKLGDYKGCVRIHEEMKQTAGLAPTLASYTSLLAACYKVCNDGRVARSIRAHAAEVGWENWMEMRITGVNADTMAYGAMLRLLAAQGRPEQAINILEEMPRFDVLPTTLCFTSALRAVARSHETAVRYEGGASRRYRRREEIAQHHGKLARTILIQAEEHGVEFDTGFIAALTLCAAAAGDVATAKAIYVASQIRRMDQFRTIGSDEHLARLRGEDVPYESNTLDLLSSGSGESKSDPKQIAGMAGVALSDQRQDEQEQSDLNLASDGDWQDKDVMLNQDTRKEPYTSFGEREYGKDSRVLSAILLACARASDKNGMGTIWQGRENKGYLCINSLRLIAARWRPQYYDNEIPGQKLTDNLTWEGEHRDVDGYRPGKRQSRKFKGITVDESSGTTLDDLDEEFYKMFVNEDGRTKEEFRKTSPEDIWRLKYGHDDPYIVDGHEPHPLNLRVAEQGRTANAIPRKLPFRLNGDSATEAGFNDSDASYELLDESGRRVEDDTTDNIFFDFETKTWRKKNEVSGEAPSPASDVEKSSKINFEVSEKESSNAGRMSRQNDIGPSSTDDDTEFYFDEKEMRWKTRPKPMKPPISTGIDLAGFNSEDKVLTKFESNAVMSPKPTATPAVQAQPDKVKGELQSGQQGFEQFFKELREEAAEMGEENVTEEEARELWLMMKDELDDVMSTDQSNSGSSRLEEMTRRLQEFDPSTHTAEKHIEMFDNDFVDSIMSGAPDASDFSSSMKGSFRRGLEGVTKEKEQKDLTKMIEDLKSDWRDQGFNLDEDDYSKISDPQLPPSSTNTSDPFYVNPDTLSTMTADPTTSSIPSTISYNPDSYGVRSIDDLSGQLEISSSGIAVPASPIFSGDLEVLGQGNIEENSKLKELRELLPALSDQRLKRILKVFKRNLGNPTLIELVPIVRENMPDYITNTWLKKMSALTANYVVQIAAEEHMVDQHILNGVLQIEAAHGSLDRALDFHQREFARHAIQPTSYSDRLVLQMFLRNNRLSRALSFKQKVEASGRTLDLKAYGTLIDYCSRRNQIGSAMLLLKECTRNHGAPPEEAMLYHLRLVCRENNMTEKLSLKKLIGDDPLEWLRVGKVMKKSRCKDSLRKARELRAVAVRG